MQSQFEIVLQRLLGIPVWHPGFEGLGQASPEEDKEAGLLCRRLTSDFPEVPGILLNAPISLTDIKELPRWTHVCWLNSVTVRARSTEEKQKSGSKCRKAQFNHKKRPTKTENRTGHHRMQRSAGVLESIDQSVQQYITQ